MGDVFALGPNLYVDSVFSIGRHPTRSAVSYKTVTYYREFFSPKRNGPEIKEYFWSTIFAGHLEEISRYLKDIS